MDESLDILAFAPHPDDAELGCGGSLILAADQGLRVAVADLTEGERASRGTPQIRAQEKRRATEILGLCERLSVGLPDTEIGAEVAHRQPVIQLIRETRPRLVLAPYWEDRHPDHAAAGKLVREACFFAGVRRVGEGRPHRPERVYFYMLHHAFAASFIIDVSRAWDRKMAAIMAYRSQFAAGGGEAETALSGPGFLRAWEARAIRLGATIGAAYGEAFFSPGPVPLGGFPGLGGAG
jgi:bacillithiol biosynthesis deacetylase BshB1